MVLNNVLLLDFINLILILAIVLFTFNIHLKTERNICRWCKYQIFAFLIVGFFIILKILSESGILQTNLPPHLILTALLLFLAMTSFYLHKCIVSAGLRTNNKLKFKVK